MGGFALRFPLAFSHTLTLNQFTRNKAVLKDVRESVVRSLVTCWSPPGRLMAVCRLADSFLVARWSLVGRSLVTCRPFASCLISAYGSFVVI